MQPDHRQPFFRQAQVLALQRLHPPGQIGFPGRGGMLVGLQLPLHLALHRLDLVGDLLDLRVLFGERDQQGLAFQVELAQLVAQLAERRTRGRRHQDAHYSVGLALAGGFERLELEFDLRPLGPGALALTLHGVQFVEGLRGLGIQGDQAVLLPEGLQRVLGLLQGLRGQTQLLLDEGPGLEGLLVVPLDVVLAVGLGKHVGHPRGLVGVFRDRPDVDDVGTLLGLGLHHEFQTLHRCQVGVFRKRFFRGRLGRYPPQQSGGLLQHRVAGDDVRMGFHVLLLLPVAPGKNRGQVGEPVDLDRRARLVERGGLAQLGKTVTAQADQQHHRKDGRLALAHDPPIISQVNVILCHVDVPYLTPVI